MKDSCFVFEVPGSGTIVAEGQEILDSTIPYVDVVDKLSVLG